jgi:hypothetical protein
MLKSPDLEIELSFRTEPSDSHLTNQLYESIAQIQFGELTGRGIRAYWTTHVKESVEPDVLRRLTLSETIKFLNAIEIWIHTPLGEATLGALIAGLIEIGKKYFDIDLIKRKNRIPYTEPEERTITIYGPNGELLKHLTITQNPEDSGEVGN